MMMKSPRRRIRVFACGSDAGLHGCFISISVALVLMMIGGCAASTATVARQYPPLPAGVSLTIDEGDRHTATQADPAAVATLDALVAEPDTPWQPSLVTYAPQTQVRAGRTAFTFTRGGWVAINSGDAEHPAPQYVRRLSESESTPVGALVD